MRPVCRVARCFRFLHGNVVRPARTAHVDGVLALAAAIVVAVAGDERRAAQRPAERWQRLLRSISLMVLLGR